MDNQSLQKLQSLLEQHGKIGIAVGKNPSVDTMGAALALYLSLQAINKQVTIAAATEPLVEVSSLVGINKVKTSLDGTDGDLVVSFPYKEGEIEKVSYTLEQGYLNIIVKAGELGLSFDEKDITFKRGGGTVPLLFVIGTPTLSDLGQLFNSEALKNTTIVNIDNKQHNQGFGEMVLLSPDFSSVSEQITEIITSLNLPLDVDTAQNLLSGIAQATNNFQSPRTSYLAFEMAALLMKKGAKRPQVQAQQPRGQFFGQQPQRQDRQRPGQRPMQQQPQQQRPQFNRPMQQRPLQQQTQTQQVQSRGEHAMGEEPTPQPERQAEMPSQEQSTEAPPDWLTPKVYRGSTSV